MGFNRDEIISTIDNGIKGRAIWSSTGFHKMEEDGVKVFPSCYTLIGGVPGSGKTAFFHEAYIHNPYNWWRNLKNKGETDIELSWIIYSMERPLLETKLKWIARKIFTDTMHTSKPLLFDVQFLRGFKSSKVTDDIKKLVFATFDYYDEMFQYIEFHSGSINPTGIYAGVKEYALKTGSIEEIPYITRDGIEKKHKIYHKNNPNRITIIGIDHIGKCLGEKVADTYFRPESRELIQRISDYCSQEFRDFYGFSPVVVSQFNRNIENTARFGNDSVIPQPSDWKNASNPYEDCDIALALFNPYKLGEKVFADYNLSAMVTPSGKNRFRAMVTLKNSYGIDDKGYGLAFFGENGYIGELKKGAEMTVSDYDKVKSFN